MIDLATLPQVKPASLEKQVDYAFVEDTSLIHVGGGSATGHF